jgi:hypothetical protein
MFSAKEENKYKLLSEREHDREFSRSFADVCIYKVATRSQHIEALHMLNIGRDLLLFSETPKISG